MTAPRITAIATASPAAAAGLEIGDELLELNGRAPRDVIEYSQLADEADLELVIRRRGDLLPNSVVVEKSAGIPLGVEVSSPVFDRVRTCDNHCAFCFIHQLPKGMRRSLYVKDDDYRLSFLYGNFTTLTRFTELDVERVIEERLDPLYVSIHATNPEVRAQLLRNPRGATSLRWLRVLLDAGLEIHGQIVVCPGINDGRVLDETLTDVLDEYPRLASVGAVPLGVSRYTREAELRPHTPFEVEAVCDLVEDWQGIFQATLGRRMIFAADEYYLLARRPFPEVATYEGFPQQENGIGMASSFAAEFLMSGATSPGAGFATYGADDGARSARGGFFSSVDGAPAAGYRAPALPTTSPVTLQAGRTRLRLVSSPSSGVGSTDPAGSTSSTTPVAIITGRYGAEVLEPLVRRLNGAASPAGRASVVPSVRLLTVDNHFFGGNIGVAGLLTGEDIANSLSHEPDGHRYLLPDACLSNGRFLDGLELEDLPRGVEVVPADGASLRQALTNPPSEALEHAAGAGCSCP